MDHGRVEREDKECRKIALYSSGAPVTFTAGSRELGKRMSKEDSVFTWDPRNMDQGGVERQDKERQPADDEGDENSAHSQGGLPLLPCIVVWS
jgi:hypothetical protein